MTTIVDMRNQVVFAYAGKHKRTPWEQKVKKMTDNQVKAIYLKLLSQGKIK